jgi:hypothetical protein
MTSLGAFSFVLFYSLGTNNQLTINPSHLLLLYMLSYSNIRLQGRVGFFERVVKVARSTLSEHVDTVRRESEFILQRGLDAGQQYTQDEIAPVAALRTSLQNMYIDRVSGLADVLFGCFDYFVASTVTLAGQGESNCCHSIHLTSLLVERNARLL